MKYILKTEKNEKCNIVFSKKKMGKGFIYLAKGENGQIGEVTKEWILRNQDNIVNLGVSGDKIYPVNSLTGFTVRLPKNYVTMNLFEAHIFKMAIEKDILPSSIYWNLTELEKLVQGIYEINPNLYVLKCFIEKYVGSSLRGLDDLYDKVKKGLKIEIKTKDFSEKEKNNEYAKMIVDGLIAIASGEMNNLYGYVIEKLEQIDWEQEENVNKKTTQQEAMKYLSSDIDTTFADFIKDSFLNEDIKSIQEPIRTLVYKLQEVIDKNFKYDADLVIKYMLKYFNIKDVMEYIDECKEAID